MKVFSAAIAAVLSLPSPSLQEGTKAPEKAVLSEADQQALGKLVFKYYRAKEQGQGESEAIEKLNQAVEDLEKKKKLDSLLRNPIEWEPILDLADDYSKGGLAVGTETTKEYSIEDVKFTYAVWVPKKYTPKTAWPLLLTVPETGSGYPKEHLAKVWNQEAIRENFVICVPKMPQDPKTWAEVEGYGKVLSPFAQISRLVHLDSNRIFLAGTGEGAKAAAAIASYFPSRFAGLILRGEDIGAPIAENFMHLPTYFARAGESVEAFTKRLEALGYKNFTVGEDDLGKIAAWAGEKVRTNYPTVLTYRPSKSAARAAYWIRVEGWDTNVKEETPPELQPIVKATIDREKNQVTVAATGVYSYMISFNDRLVDMDKPVTVVTNGKAWVGTIARSLQRFLDRSFERGDNRLVFTGTQYFQVPPPAAESSAK